MQNSRRSRWDAVLRLARYLKQPPSPAQGKFLNRLCCSQSRIVILIGQMGSITQEAKAVIFYLDQETNYDFLIICRTRMPSYGGHCQQDTLAVNRTFVAQLRIIKPSDVTLQ